MTKKTNRICFTCGKSYRYCPQCSEDIDKPAYMTMWCSENCYNINNVLSDYTSNKISKEETKLRLLKLNYDIEIEDKGVVDTINYIVNSTKDRDKKVVEDNHVTDIEEQKNEETEGNGEVETEVKEVKSSNTYKSSQKSRRKSFK